MSPSIVASLIFLAVLLLTLFWRCGAADSNTTYDLRYKICSTSGNLNDGGGGSGLYQQNLRQFLAALPSNTINNSGFFNGTSGSPPGMSGSPPGTVFGMAMCHADIPWPDQCGSCLHAASAEAPRACPSSTTANVAYQGCVLRYSDEPIAAAVVDDEIPNGGYAFYTKTHAAVAPDAAAFFGETRKELFADLASAAAVSPLMIASGNRTFNGTHNLYGLAQCNRDLPRESCSEFVSTIAEGIPEFLPDVQWSEGLSITRFDFYIRYDLTPFRVYEPPTGSDHRPEIIQGGLVKKVAIIVIPVSISIIILLLAFIILRHYKKKWEIIKVFSYGEIRSATRNFAKDHEIGEGGFGKVYKGTFKINGKTEDLAVKCVTNDSARKHLLDELKMLARLEHKNVLRLKGFCNNDGWFLYGKSGSGLYVCNEYFDQGSLDRHICASEDNPRPRREPLRWPIRYEIIRGICFGLKYLHEDCNDTIAHMDIKPSNILLGQKMVPKIADFGLSRTFVMAKTHTYTAAAMGTNGYMAPELTENNTNEELKLDRKCDIYSLGVLILAIVMGKEPTATDDPNGASFIRKIDEKFGAENREKFSGGGGGGGGSGQAAEEGCIFAG